ncbi:hypothetical protein [Paraglaciecola chathamensis]|uniref:PhoD-like phosphatase metallophosphatase domain-containing protein n=1 Tax=Paraglaciecola chathamensis S18K6 TaxID=1127672 RepID=A0AAV3UZ79_9ALTE|nr:hypothetical protein [Paraglaciecola chathamensis]GAC10100.1 hypothetical protein GCHA_2149 [Paraglaciecola chathamensis S18K6]
MKNSYHLLSRRRFLQLAAASSTSLAFGGVGAYPLAAPNGVATNKDWHQGELKHLIPLVNHHQMLIKTSFEKPLDFTPMLRVDDKMIMGKRTDTLGRFWQFFVTDLQADQQYELQLTNTSKETITDSWPLKTFPAPDAEPESLRIFAFTCAGGNEDVAFPDGTHFFQSLAVRQALFKRGLSFNPDVVISNGDHIYWDQRSAFMRPDHKPEFREPWLKAFEEYGYMDRDKPVLGTENESILTGIVDAQIADLYGVTFRSVPVFMLTDDHDMFENDDATEDLITLPPDPHMLDSARTTQSLYYPEFLPDDTRPVKLSGSNNADRLSGLSENFGTLRYGSLFEGLLYDTKRFSTIDGANAQVIPLEAEHWLAQRNASDDVQHLAHIPSTPIGWSAGKWGEWYPDVLQANGKLGKQTPKPYWPEGWWLQHQRILTSIHKQTDRAPVIMSGDLHAFSCGKIRTSGELDFSDNPINTMCVGTVGSSDPVFASWYRKVGPQIPTDMELENLFPPLEKNGFSIIDVTPEKITVNMFAWRQPESVDAIETMEPFFSYDIARPKGNAKA